MKLVCSDLDRTLLPNGEQHESPHARAILWHLLRTYDVDAAYVSGRDFNRVLEAIEEYDLAEPLAIVADVGTNIHWRKHDAWQFDKQWQRHIGTDWKNHDSEDVQRLLEPVVLLTGQNVDRQSQFKCSFFYRYGECETQLAEQIQEILQAKAIRAALLFSHDPLTNQGLLDVVPRSATKREAVAYISKKTKIREQDILFAGDSGNDVTALLADHPGVLVANADHATRSVIERQCASMKKPANIYKAQGELAVLGHGMLNGYYSAGIVEGLLHYQPEWKTCLNDPAWLKAALT